MHRITDDSGDIIAKCESKTKNNPNYTYSTHYNETLEHCADYILGLNHTAVEKRQSGRHHQHKYCGGNHPGNVGTGLGIESAYYVKVAWGTGFQYTGNAESKN